MMICHLCNINVEWLIEEAFERLKVSLTKEHIVFWVNHEIFDVTINFNHRDSSIVHVVDISDPLVLDLFIQLLANLK